MIDVTSACVQGVMQIDVDGLDESKSVGEYQLSTARLENMPG